MKAASKLAFQRWRDNGCPLSGALFDAKQNAKREYKRALKDLKLYRNRARLQRMSECIGNSSMSSFWKLWNKHKHASEPSVVSGLDADDFVSNFKQNFIVSSDNSHMVELFLQQYSCCNSNDTMLSFSVEDIEKACVSSCK